MPDFYICHFCSYVELAYFDKLSAICASFSNNSLQLMCFNKAKKMNGFVGGVL